jgi:predicted RNase H-like nuclease
MTAPRNVCRNGHTLPPGESWCDVCESTAWSALSSQRAEADRLRAEYAKLEEILPYVDRARVGRYEIPFYPHRDMVTTADLIEAEAYFDRMIRDTNARPLIAVHSELHDKLIGELARVVKHVRFTQRRAARKVARQRKAELDRHLYGSD